MYSPAARNPSYRRRNGSGPTPSWKSTFCSLVTSAGSPHPSSLLCLFLLRRQILCSSAHPPNSRIPLRVLSFSLFPFWPSYFTSLHFTFMYGCVQACLNGVVRHTHNIRRFALSSPAAPVAEHTTPRPAYQGSASKHILRASARLGVADIGPSFQSWYCTTQITYITTRP